MLDYSIYLALAWRAGDSPHLIKKKESEAGDEKPAQR